MKIERHGLSIGLERYGEDIYLSLKAVGKLTHDDYELITPLIDEALKGVRQPSVQVLVDVFEFEGWELRAAWDDFRLGLKHGNDFDKLAICGDAKWQKNMARIANWFIAGEARFFTDRGEAITWLTS